MTCIYRSNRTPFKLIKYFKRLNPAVRKEINCVRKGCDTAVFACLSFLIRNLFGNFNETWYEG